MTLCEELTKEIRKNGTLEERLFLMRSAENDDKCVNAIFIALETLKEEGLSAAEIKGAFEYAARTCCIFIHQ